MIYPQDDERFNFYFQDKWQVNRRLTLNLGLRYDKQDLVDTNTAFAPRLGVAYDLSGNGRTVLRGGIGKFYEYQPLTIRATLLTQPVVSEVDHLRDGRGRELRSTENSPSDPCLTPSGDGAGRALIGPQCRADLTDIRNQVFDGAFTNANPSIDGDRKLGYLWSFSVGFKQQIGNTIAVGVDYIGNRGKDQTGLIDLNEPTDGVRPQADGFDPSGALVPAGLAGRDLPALPAVPDAGRLRHRLRRARALTGEAVRESVGRSCGVHALRGPRRRARRVASLPSAWTTTSTRAPTTPARTSTTGTGSWPAPTPTSGAAWAAASASSTTRATRSTRRSGRDVNRDNDAFDRPVAGVDDATRPIVSELDADGRAIRNGIDGEEQFTVDARFQYIFRPNRNEIGFFWEIYNLTNRVNFGNPTGNRNSANFLVPVAAQAMRTMQLGVRYTF